MRIIELKSGRKIKVVEASEHSKFISSNDKEMDARAVEAVRVLFCTLIVASFFTLIDGDTALC